MTLAASQSFELRFVAPSRRVGDPAADGLLDALFSKDHLTPSDADAILGRLSRNDDPLPAHTPPRLRAFLTTHALPTWADPARLRRGQAFFERNALVITISLFCVSLPTAFAGAKGAAVLDVTQRLRTDIDRRVNETGRFVFDVLAPGAFDPRGRAVRSAQKVRLMHAAVRRLARARGVGGDEVPINQEDLVGTLLCFSVVVLDALDDMGVRVLPSEAEDYLYVWRVVGSILGVLPRHLPRDVAHARRIGRSIRSRELAPSRHGRELARVLLDGVERHLPLGGLGLAPGLMRYLLGDELADILALPRGLGSSDVGRLVRWRPKDAVRSTRARSIDRVVLEGIIAAKLGGRAPSYHHPLSILGSARGKGTT